MQDGQRDVEFINESCGLKSQSNITMKLIRKTIDKTGPKAAPSGLLDRWATFLGPRQFEQLRFFIDRQFELYIPGGVGQCAVFDRICGNRDEVLKERSLY